MRCPHPMATLLMTGAWLASSSPLAQIVPPRLEPRQVEIPENLPDRRKTLPLRPNHVSPPAGTAQGGWGSPGLVLSWNQGGLTLGGAPQARYFVVCIDAPTAPACAWPGQFNMLASSLASEPYVHPTFGAQPYARVYRFPLPGAAIGNYLDRDLVWTVGACTGTTTATCSFSGRRSVYWSTRNLKSPRVSARDYRSDGTNYFVTFDVRADNDGESPSGPFTVRVEFYSSHLTSSNDCLTDVNAPSVRPTDSALLRNGQLVTILGLPRDATGRRVAADVVAIVAAQPTNLLLFPLPTTAGSVAANSTDRPVASFPYTFSWTSHPSSPKRFAAVVSLDADNQIREFNEADNIAGVCARPIMYR